MTAPLQFAVSLAQQAGDLLLDFFRHADLQTNFKPDHSVVTEADLAADELISKAIQEQYPGDMLLSEETQTRYPNGTNPTQPPVWIIDPLDGTTNFSLGLHFWGISIARLVKGVPETAVLYYPLIEELYTAERGRGAFLNDEPIHIQPPRVEYPLPFFACCSRTFRQYNVEVPYKVRVLGSASYTFCAVARGIAVLGFEATPKIWDIAGAWLLVEEAGGTIETLHGSEPFPLETAMDYAGMDFPTLAAATPQLASKARGQIQPRSPSQAQAAPNDIPSDSM